MQKRAMLRIGGQEPDQSIRVTLGRYGIETRTSGNMRRPVAHAIGAFGKTGGVRRSRRRARLRCQHDRAECAIRQNRGLERRNHQGRDDRKHARAVSLPQGCCETIGLRHGPRNQDRNGAGLQGHDTGVTCEVHLAQRRTMQTSLTFLGIESSCDDSAAAVVRAGASTEILSSVVEGQVALHAAYGGVVPEIAARAHAERLDGCVEKALAEAGLRMGDLDGIAVTAGPGLIGGVLSGVMLAKGLAAGTGLPLVGVNHLAGHALTPRLTDNVAYPYLMLLVSGGHCQFLIVLGPDEFRRIGGTIDDAPGEAFDKTAKLLGLPQPGGPAVEAEAAFGNDARFAFPRPLLDRPGCDMSFSGLKTALLRARDELVAAQGGLTRTDRHDLCASFQRAVAAVLQEKSRRALVEYGALNPEAPTFAVAGGVAANGTVRAALETLCATSGVRFLAPPLKLCTDNAAMIAYAGIERFRLGSRDDATLSARPRWPLDLTAPAMIGSGKKGAKA
jgi:N6-L-threonylcarbamoyladenine synthase